MKNDAKRRTGLWALTAIATAIVIGSPAVAGVATGRGSDAERPTVTASTEAGDGRIAFVRNSNNGKTDVASVRKGGRGYLNITSSRRNELYVDVSPDGRWVAFTRFGPNGGEIFKAPITGGEATRLTSNRIHEELGLP